MKFPAVRLGALSLESHDGSSPKSLFARAYVDYYDKKYSARGDFAGERSMSGGFSVEFQGEFCMLEGSGWPDDVVL